MVVERITKTLSMATKTGSQIKGRYERDSCVTETPIIPNRKTTNIEMMIRKQAISESHQGTMTFRYIGFL